MQISEIMHQGVVSANIDDTVKAVARMMKNEDIGAVPVLENGRPVGIVTDRDIVVSCVAEGSSSDESIRQAMSEGVITINRDTSIEEATRLMQDEKVSRLLVMENNKPIGMVSMQDLTQTRDEDLTGETLSSIKRQ